MNPALITAISTGIVTVAGAVTALIVALKNKGAIEDHIASHSDIPDPNAPIVPPETL